MAGSAAVPFAVAFLTWSGCLLMVCMGDGQPVQEFGWESSVAELGELAARHAAWEAIDYAAPRSLAVAERRLFEYSNSGVADMCHSAMGWIRNTTSSVALAVGHAFGLDTVVELFKNATKWVTQGYTAAQAGWTSMMALGKQLMHIYDDFKPLKPIFANSSGLVALITSPTNMGILYHVVRELMNTTDVLHDLSGALHLVSGMFTELQNLFQTFLGSVQGKGRRLLGGQGAAAGRALAGAVEDYTSLLQGLNFTGMVGLMRGFVETLMKHSVTLLEVRDTFSPLLTKLDSLGMGRRLSISIQSIMDDQKKYSAAISEIVPTWQGIEKVAISMCPLVSDAQTGSGSLKCRVSSFVTKAAMPSWASSMLSSLVTGCPPPSGGNGTAAKGACPLASLSAGVDDLLGQNAQSLGLIIAVVAAIAAALGLGGGIVAKVASKGAGSESEGESDEEHGSHAHLVSHG